MILKIAIKVIISKQRTCVYDMSFTSTIRCKIYTILDTGYFFIIHLVIFT